MRPVRTTLLVLAGYCLGAVVCLYVPMPRVDAQGVGFFGTSTSGTRTNCTAITSPVIGQTVCLDQAANVWKYYTGATQSTAQWVASVASQSGVNNVKDFGAVGDNATDDTAAITRAVLKTYSGAVNGTIQPARIVYFPPGFYKISSAVEIPPNVIVRGAGRFSINISAADPTGSVINKSHDGVAFRFVDRNNAGAGSLWQMGGIEDMGFSGNGSSDTTASRFIEMGDAAAVTNSTGAWELFIRRVTFSNSNGYGIFSAHSQLAMIERNWFNQVKFPIYYNTVVSAARIVGNTFLDQSNIAGAIAMQFRPGSLGGSVGGPWVLGNYTLGFQYAIWNTSISGISVRDNVFEGTYQVPVWFDSFLSDNATQDGAGPAGGVIDGNTFINWSAAAATAQPAIQLSYTQNVWVGENTYQSPNGSLASGSMINWFDNACNPQCTQGNVVVEPICTGSNCAGVLAVPAVSNSLGRQNTLIGRTFFQPQSRQSDLTVGTGSSGRFWWDRATNRYRYSDGSASIFTFASSNVLNLTGAGVTVGNPSAGDPGSGVLRVASAVDLNATRTIWNGAATTGTPLCTNNCGTAPSLVGTNTAMRVTMGATGTPRSPFLVLFNGAWNAAPACIAQLTTATTTTVSVVNSTTTGVSVNTVIGPAQGDVYAIHCLGAG